MNGNRLTGYIQYGLGLAVGAFWAGKPIWIAVAFGGTIFVCARIADTMLRALTTRWRTAWEIAGVMTAAEMSFARWTGPRWWIAVRLFFRGRASNGQGAYISISRGDR